MEDRFIYLFILFIYLFILFIFILFHNLAELLFKGNMLWDIIEKVYRFGGLLMVFGVAIGNIARPLYRAIYYIHNIVLVVL